MYMYIGIYIVIVIVIVIVILPRILHFFSAALIISPLF